MADILSEVQTRQVPNVWIRAVKVVQIRLPIEVKEAIIIPRLHYLRKCLRTHTLGILEM
jgi:hypothetical protein